MFPWIIWVAWRFCHNSEYFCCIQLWCIWTFHRKTPKECTTCTTAQWCHLYKDYQQFPTLSLSSAACWWPNQCWETWKGLWRYFDCIFCCEMSQQNLNFAEDRWTFSKFTFDITSGSLRLWQCCFSYNFCSCIINPKFLIQVFPKWRRAAPTNGGRFWFMFKTTWKVVNRWN